MIRKYETPSTRPLLTALAALVLVTLVLTNAASAQQSPVKFDPSRHLSGFDEAAFSEYSHLYDTDRFESMSGKSMTPAELEEIRAVWATELARVRTLIEKTEKSPTLRTLHLIERQMSRHHYFSRISYSRILDFEPVVLLVQDLQKPDSRYTKMVIDRYGPPLAQMAALFKKRYAEPLDLRLRRGHEAFVLVVLASHGDYKNYMDAVSHRGTFTNGAHYDHDLRVAVIYENAFDRSKSPEGPCRRAALFTMALNVLHAHRAYSDLPQQSGWIYEGIAENLSRPAQDGRALAPEKIEMKSLRDIAAMVRNPTQRRAFFLHPAELMAARTQDGIYKLMEPRTAVLGKNRAGWWGRGIAFYQKQAGLLVHFLENGQGGKYAIPFLKHFEKLMAANEPPPKQLKNLAGAPIDELAGEYIAFVGAQLELNAPDLAFNATTRRALTEKKKPAASPDEEPAADSPYAGSAVIKASFDPASLQGGDVAANDAFCMALHAARCGRIDEALLQVRGLRAVKLRTGAIAKLAGREQERLEALSGLREAFLETARGSTKKMRIEHDGKKITGTVAKFDSETFCLDTGRKGEVSIPITAFTPVELARQVRDRKLSLCDEWVLAYGYLLGGNKLWKKYSRGAAPQARALADDASQIQKCLARGEIMALLGDLARTPLPESADAARAIAASIETLLGEYAETDAVSGRRENLEHFAAFCYARMFDALPFEEVTSFIQGEVERPKKDRLRITYAFDDPVELADFEESDYLEDLREGLPPIETKREDSFFKIEKGSLRCKGKACRRLRVDLAAPLKISYSLIFDCRGLKTVPSGWFLVGCCEDGFGNGIRCINLGNLECRDKRANILESDFNEDGYCQSNVIYELEMVHDGEELKSFVDGEQRRVVAAGDLQQGGIYLWTNHDVTMVVKKLVIEGAPGPAFVNRLRDQWVAEKLAALEK